MKDFMSYVSSLTGNSLLSYLQGAAAKAQQNAELPESASTTIAQSNRTTTVTKAAVMSASQTHQISKARVELDKKQVEFSKDLKSAMAEAGVKLDDSVTFKISSAGKISINGDAADKDKIENFLKNDKSTPSLSTRLVSIITAAESVSKTINQTAAIAQAARYASGPSGVLSLYSILSQQQDNNKASFNLTSTGSSLSYAGVLTSIA